MNSRQDRVSDSIDSAHGCLTLDEFKIPRLAQLRRELDDTVRDIKALRVKQDLDTNRRQDSRKIESLREELRVKHLIPISREGKRRLKGTPGIADALHVPHKRAKDTELLDAAARILENAEPHAAVFRKALFPRDFITRARRAAKALAKEHAANANRPPVRGSRATHDLKAALSEGREIIRSIDGIVEAEFFDDTVTLHVWRKARRIPKKAGRPKKRRPRPESDDGPPA